MPGVFRSVLDLGADDVIGECRVSLRKRDAIPAAFGACDRLVQRVEDAEPFMVILRRTYQRFTLQAYDRRGCLGQLFLAIGGVVVVRGNPPQSVLEFDVEDIDASSVFVVGSDTQPGCIARIVKVRIELFSDITEFVQRRRLIRGVHSECGRRQHGSDADERKCACGFVHSGHRQVDCLSLEDVLTICRTVTLGRPLGLSLLETRGHLSHAYGGDVRDCPSYSW